MKWFLLLAGISCASFSSSWALEGGNCQMRDVVVNVRDEGENFVAGLGPASFEVAFDHEPMRVVSDRIVHSNARVILLLDLSGSQSHRLSVAKLASEHLVANMSGSLRLAMVTFSDRVLETLDFNSSPREILEHISKIREATGHTSLYDSLTYAAGLFGSREAGDAIYAVTDGDDNRSTSGMRPVERLLASKGIRLFWLDFHDRYLPPRMSETGQDDLKYLVDSGGGLTVTVENPESLKGQGFDKIISGIYGAMRNFYVLSLETPGGADDRRPWKVEVVDEGGKRPKGLRVFYPKHLPSCVSDN